MDRFNISLPLNVSNKGRSPRPKTNRQEKATAFSNLESSYYIQKRELQNTGEPSICKKFSCAYRTERIFI